MLTVRAGVPGRVEASRVHAAAAAPSAGVMPVQWNHAAPANTRAHGTLPGAISLIAECARS